MRRVSFKSSTSVDRFKSINDTHGHAAGDEVLKGVAKRLIEHGRGEDTVCRNGGDEFLCVMMDPRGSQNIERIAGALLKAIGQTIDIGTLQPVVNVSIGIAVYPDDGTTEEQLIKNAYAAMYRAENTGGGRICFNALETEETSTNELIAGEALSG